AHVCVINAHARAGFDRCLDDFSRLVQNVTTPVENITARVIRTILTNNERFGRLITGSRAFFSRRSDDRSGHLYRFCRSCSLFFICRTRLGECQKCNQHTSNREYYFFHVRLLLLMHFLLRKLLELVTMEQEPLRVFLTA